MSSCDDRTFYTFIDLMSPLKSNKRDDDYRMRDIKWVKQHEGDDNVDRSGVDYIQGDKDGQSDDQRVNNTNSNGVGSVNEGNGSHGDDDPNVHGGRDEDYKNDDDQDKTGIESQGVIDLTSEISSTAGCGTRARYDAIAGTDLDSFFSIAESCEGESFHPLIMIKAEDRKEKFQKSRIATPP